jgi:PIN domain nuclease of toxin-antitoxin system
VRLPLDTHVLLWVAAQPEKLPASVVADIQDRENRIFFSVVSLWEIVIKRSLGRPDFVVEPRQLREGLLDGGYEELPFHAAHALAVEDLPPLHRDPFDRALLAQAKIEGALLVTADAILADYPASVRMI